MKVPKVWNDVTVGQYQAYMPYYIKAVQETDSLKAIDYWTIVIAILTNSQKDEIESLPIDQIKAIIKRLSFLSSLPSGRRKFLLYLNGKLYKAPKEAKEFNTDRYIDYKTFYGRGSAYEILDLILATIYTPYYKKSKQSHEERVKEFKTAKMSDVYPVVFFYSIQYKVLINRTTQYGIKEANKELKKAQQILMETLRETLEDIGDGTIHSAKSLSKHPM